MIVVAGEHLVDLIVDPSSGATTTVPGGGPFTTARTIARLGGDVAFLAACSTDRFGRDARTILEADGVRTEHLVATDAPTTLALAEIGPDGGATYRFYLAGTAAGAVSVAALEPLLAGPPPTAVHIGTLGLVLEPLATTIEALVARLPVATLLMLDVNARPLAITDPTAFRSRVARLLPRTDVVQVSAEDLAFLYPELDPDAALESVASGSGTTGAPGCVLRTGGEGLVRVVVGSTSVDLPVVARSVVDTVGAGDVFGGAFLHALLADGPDVADPIVRARARDAGAVEAAARFAIVAASLSVGAVGARPPSAAEVALASTR